MDEIVTIVIVDDHEIFRLGLNVMLNNINYTKVIGEASDSTQLFNLLKKNQPDLIFMDINLGNENGIEISKKVLAKYPNIYIVAITASDEISYFNEMIDAGAVGFLLKNITEIELRKALDEILNGNMYFAKEFLLIARQLNPSQTRKSSIQLSEREKEVLRLICHGYSNQEIANELFLSYHTVDAHRRNLLTKTGAKNTASMIMTAFKEGLIEYQ